MDIHHLINQASEFELDNDDVLDFTKSRELSLVDFVNMFAIELAKGYQNGKYDFEFGDCAANWLFQFMTNEIFLSSNNNTLPSPAFDVYLAFDVGEYHHFGDTDDVIPHLKYTKPQINEILDKSTHSE